METLAGWIFTLLSWVAFGSWAIAFYSQIGVFRNMGAGFWNVIFLSHWLLFNKEKLQLNEAGERHRELFFLSLKVFLGAVLGMAVMFIALIWLEG